MRICAPSLGRQGVAAFVATVVVVLMQSGATGAAPVAPTGVQATSASATTISLTWSLGGGGDPPLAGLRVTATPTPSPAPVPATVSVFLVVSSPVTAHTLTGLSPGYEYSIAIVAVDTDGDESPPSSPPVLASTSPSPPAAPTDVALAAPPAGRAFDVAWTPPADSGTSAGSPTPIAAYHVAYEAVEGPGAGVDIVTVTPSAAASATVSVSVLPGTTYAVSVATLNSLGLLSPFSAPISVFVPVGPPDPPSAITLSAFSLVAPPLPTTPPTYAATLAFTPPLATGSAAATVAAYNLTLTRLTGPHAPYPPLASRLPPAGPYPLEGLATGSSYSVSLITLNSDGVYSAPRTRTRPTPLGPPSAPNALALAATAPPAALLSASWLPPTSTGGDTVALANATLTLTADGAPAPAATLTLAAPLPASVAFPSLAPGTAYTVAVVVTNTGGLSSPAVTAAGATPVGTPAQPTNPALAYAGEAFVAIAFDAPSAAALGGPLASLTSVTVALAAGGGAATVPASAVVVDGARWIVSTEFTALRLAASTAYSVTIALTNSGGLSSPFSPVVAFTTAVWGTDARVRLSPAPPLVVHEYGAALTFSLALAAAPELGTTVVVPLAVDATYAVLSPTELTFAAAAWDTPQDVTVAPVRSAFAARGAGPGFSPELALALAVGPVSVGGAPAPPAPGSAFFATYAGSMDSAFTFVDGDVVGVNATALLRVAEESDGAPAGTVAMLELALVPLSQPAGVLTLDTSSSPLLAEAAGSSVGVPGTAAFALDAGAVAALDVSAVFVAGVVVAESAADAAYGGLEVRAEVANGPGFLAAVPGGAAADESTWRKYFVLWVVLICVAVICVVGAVGYAVLRVASADAAFGGQSKRMGSNAVAPSPEPSPRDVATVTLGATDASLDPDAPASPDDVPRRSVLSTGARSLPPLRGTPRARTAASPTLVVGGRYGPGSPHGAAATPLARGVSPARPGIMYTTSPAVRGSTTTTPAAWAAGGVARGARSPGELDDTGLTSNMSRATPSSARRRPLALPYIQHADSPIPFLAKGARADPLTPIPYLPSPSRPPPRPVADADFSSSELDSGSLE